MAARHLQKLRATQLVEPDAEGSEASEEEAPSSKEAPFNPFDLLSDDEVCLQAAASAFCQLKLALSVQCICSKRLSCEHHMSSLTRSR